MIYLLPWEMPEILKDFYIGPCLFMALYRFYKNAYFGQGFHLSGKHIKDNTIKTFIDQLPLDLKRIIFSKIWENGKPYEGIVVKKGQLYLPFHLHYLFVQYGRLKHIIKPTIPRVYAGWTGYITSRKEYIFTYGPINPNHTPLIPKFMCKEKHNHFSPSFSLIFP